jgi:glucosamine--fructose-6-phosphate aminotransferase (isomerizing)
MTELMKDILRQPEELAKALAYTLGPGRSELERAAREISEAQHIYITGIGSSWHAGMAISSLLDAGGRPACLLDASEFLHFTQITKNSAILVLSRSGRSIEIVNLLSKAKHSGAKIIAITNTAKTPLVEAADVTLYMEAAFDHFVSITMYSALALVGGLLASRVLNDLNASLVQSLTESLLAVRDVLDPWIQQIQGNTWFEPNASTYFLARGTSLASCHEARLLWEEAAKAPATAMTTGGFRHGPQEVIVDGFRFGIWIDQDQLRHQDLAVATDLRKLGGKVMLIGQNLSADAGDLVFSLPKIPDNWQFLVDIIPAQLAAEYLCRLRAMDCDSFRICSYVVENEYGLIDDKNREAPPPLLRPFFLG